MGSPHGGTIDCTLNKSLQQLDIINKPFKQKSKIKGFQVDSQHKNPPLPPLAAYFTAIINKNKN